MNEETGSYRIRCVQKRTHPTCWSTNAGDQIVPYADGGNNVVKSTGTGTNWNSNFYRKGDYTLSSGDVVQLRFKVDNLNVFSHYSIESSNQRFGLLAVDGALKAQYNLNTGWNYSAPLIDHPEINTWYVLRLILDDVNGFSIVFYKESDPSQNGSFTVLMNPGQNWRFHHWILNGHDYVDDYREYSVTNVDNLPNAVTGLSNGNSYTYDANGSMISRTILERISDQDINVTYTMTYDAEGHMISLENDLEETHPGNFISNRYVYDGDGILVLWVEGNPNTAEDNKRTIRLGSFEVVLSASNRTPGTVPNPQPASKNGNDTYSTTMANPSTGNVIWKCYYGSLAMRVQTNTETSVNYLLTDHLGSVYKVIGQSDGGLVTENHYSVWGITSSSTARITDKTYTGQEASDNSGLIFYQSRWYDPYLNHWVQPDSIIPDPNNPLDYDRYAYVRNNPVNFNDPSGNCSGSATDENNKDKDCWDEYFLLVGLYRGIHFIDPSNWTLDQLVNLAIAMFDIVKNGFDLDFAAFNKAFKGVSIFHSNFPKDHNASGMSIPGLKWILLTDDMLSGGDEFGIIHEFGHQFDYQNGISGYYYFSHGYADLFNKNPYCNTSIVGCLPYPSSKSNYDGLQNIIGEGNPWNPPSPTNSWDPVGGFYRSYATNSSLDDYAGTFAALCTNQSSPMIKARIDYIKKNIEGFKK